MSKLIVEVCRIEEIKPHFDPETTRIEMARVKNWWCVVGKNQYKPGDKVVYLPPDSVISKELAESWGVAKYCAILAKNPDGSRPTDLRIRASRLRGERSFGLIIQPDDPSWEVGLDVKDHYGVKKYEPPLKTHDGDAAPEIPGFHKYTDIENIGNYTGIFKDGERVIVTEKIHGTNCRLGIVGTSDGFEFVAGSMEIRRKETDAKGNRSRYWFPFENQPGIKELLQTIFQEQQVPVVLFGEIFGSGVQDMQYGQTGMSFRAFDISVNGRYLNYDDQVALFERFFVKMVPVLFDGPFSMDKMNELVDGPTTICDESQIKEHFKGREGIVIKPAEERLSGDLQGRVVLKFISVDYHERRNKNRTEDH